MSWRISSALKGRFNEGRFNDDHFEQLANYNK